MGVTIAKLSGSGSAASAQILPSDSFAFGPYNAILRTITFDNAYASGGESFTPDDISFNKIYAVAILDINTSAFEVRYDKTNEKLIVEPARATTISSTTTLEFLDQSGLTVTVLILGR